METLNLEALTMLVLLKPRDLKERQEVMKYM